jgi:hypothetical protein
MIPASERQTNPRSPDSHIDETFKAGVTDRLLQGEGVSAAAFIAPTKSSSFRDRLPPWHLGRAKKTSMALDGRLSFRAPIPSYGIKARGKIAFAHLFLCSGYLILCCNSHSCLMLINLQSQVFVGSNYDCSSHEERHLSERHSPGPQLRDHIPDHVVQCVCPFAAGIGECSPRFTAAL